MQTSPSPRGQKEWHTLMKILPCPKLRLRTVASYLITMDHDRYISYVYLAIKSTLYVFNRCHKKYTYITFLQNLQHVLPNSKSDTRLWLGTWSLIFCPSAEGRLSAAEMLLCALVKHISSQDFDNDRPNSHHYQPPKFMYWLCLAKIPKWTSFTKFRAFPYLTTTENILSSSYKGIWTLELSLTLPWK